jgi:hypothetical protein
MEEGISKFGGMTVNRRAANNIELANLVISVLTLMLVLAIWFKL